MKKLISRLHTPLDTNIIFLHKILILCMVALFCFSKYAQMERQSPSCTGSGLTNLDHARKLRICITTVAYVQYKDERKYTNGFGLYLPGALFIIGLLFLVPLWYQEFYEDKHLKKLFSEAPEWSEYCAVKNIDVVIMYSHGAMSRRVLLSWECMEVDFYALLMLDIVSSTNLLSKIIFGCLTRGWEYVGDMWEITYPTNVKCEIGPQMVYAASNTEHYRCIIPHNEIYKYIWMAAALLVVMSMALSVVSFLFHIAQIIWFRRQRFLDGVIDVEKDTVKCLASRLPGGDDALFLLRAYLLRLPNKESRSAVLQELLNIIHKADW